MGFRTVVIFSNDRCSEWENDPELGKKISRDMYKDASNPYTPLNTVGGEVLECIHADMQTLAVLDGYGGTALAYGHWNHKQTDKERNLSLLKNLAEKMGYRVCKKPTRK